MYFFCNFFKTRESKVNDYTTISIAPRVEDKWFGLGVPISNQTLPPDPLGLSKQEMKDIIHFIQSLTDTSSTLPAHFSLSTVAPVKE